ncbi:MAG: LysR substrate-binding domain-containing protein [Pseudomonadota bacterium]
MHNPIIPDLKGLRTLKAIRESGSLADAATRLHLTPSALSHQLRELEESVGMALLVRKTRPPELTRAGQRLLLLAERVTDAVREAERDIGRLYAGSSGTLTLASGCAHSFGWLMPVVGAFHGNWPDVALDIVPCPEEWPHALRDGALDLVVSASPPPPRSGLSAARLFEYELLLLVSPDHAMAARPFVTPADLAAETLLCHPEPPEEESGGLSAFLSPASRDPSRVRHADRDDVLVQLAASGHGVTVLPAWVAADAVNRGWVRGLRMGRDGIWRTMHAVSRDGSLSQAFMRDFIGSMRDACFARLSGVRAAGGGHDGERVLSLQAEAG